MTGSTTPLRSEMTCCEWTKALPDQASGPQYRPTVRWSALLTDCSHQEQSWSRTRSVAWPNGHHWEVLDLFRLGERRTGECGTTLDASISVTWGVHACIEVRSTPGQPFGVERQAAEAIDPAPDELFSATSDRFHRRRRPCEPVRGGSPWGMTHGRSGEEPFARCLAESSRRA